MKQGLWFLYLSGIIIIVFLFQIMIPGFTELFVLNGRALEGEYWRFISAIFLHGSLPHLLYNLFALLFFGISLEKLSGSKRFLIIFFLTGIVANIISVNFYDSSLGASGSIMGVIGAVTAIRPLMMVWAFGLIMPLFIASILWAIGDVLGIFIPQGVGNIAHLSGLGIGIVIGILLRNIRRKKSNNKIVLPDYYVKLWEDKYVK